MGNTPTYNVFTTKENVIGVIRFYSEEDGYYGELKLTNFPPDYIPSYLLGTSPISAPNYETLKTNNNKTKLSYFWANLMHTIVISIYYFTLSRCILLPEEVR